MSEWKDISTAPKDGEVFLYVPSWGNTPIGAYYIHKEYGDEVGLEEGWYASLDYDFPSDVHIANPTHWQKLPEPPK